MHEVESFARENDLTLQNRDTDLLRVLIVDDDQDVARALYAFLEDLSDPLTVELAFDGFEAGAKVQSFQPHLVLLDLVMPGLDGFAVCARLKSDPATSAIRVIAMTGHHNADVERRIREAGAEACLVKPLDLALLVRTVGLSQTEVTTQ